jgi:hypothetical protein
MAVKDKMGLICGTLWTLDKIFVSFAYLLVSANLSYLKFGKSVYFVVAPSNYSSCSIL